MAKQIFEILSPTKTISTLYSGPANWSEADSAVIDVEGFDSFENITVETVPKLFGPGSYIRNKRLEETTLSITGRVLSPNIRNILASLKYSAKNFETITIRRTLTKNGEVETISGLITGVEWNEIKQDEEVEFSVRLKSTSALKNMTLDGVTISTL